VAEEDRRACPDLLSTEKGFESGSCPLKEGTPADVGSVLEETRGESHFFWEMGGKKEPGRLTPFFLRGVSYLFNL